MPIHIRVLLVWLLVCSPLAAQTAPPTVTLESTVASFIAAVPTTSEGFAEIQPNEIARLATAVDYAAAAIDLPQQPAAIIAHVDRLLKAKALVDQCLEATLKLRTELAGIEPVEKQRAALRGYLRVMASLIGLSGRMRHWQFDVISLAAADLATRPLDRERLVDLLLAQRSSIGAEVMADLLFDPPPDSDAAGQIPSEALRSKVLKLIAATSQIELLPQLARFVTGPRVRPSLVLQAAETIRQIGLPQEPRPGHDTKLPAPAITARQLISILSGMRLGRAERPLMQRRDALIAWLTTRARKGVTEESYQLGAATVQPGDWLLMRNPSPYNLFTDISPGLFTHVGIVAAEQGADGIRRFVIVDMPEPGTRMPATNVETFVKRTRHYMFVRHQDPAVGRKMNEVALSVIGNETQFDLNFRTGRLQEYLGQNLKGKKIVTYCAGLLLLCAQETGVPREQFFPVAEYTAPGSTKENLEQFGMAFGNDFVSPTGALFSKSMAIIGRREPMYDPRREVEEAVFDYFATSLVDKKMTVATDMVQTLRMKVAETAKQNSALAKALVSAAGVNSESDVVAAARAKAVIETLDEVAFGSSGEYVQAQAAFNAPEAKYLREEGYKPQQIAAIEKYRQRHKELYAKWEKQELHPRVIRIELVKYYTVQGQQQIDRRFFEGK